MSVASLFAGTQLLVISGKRNSQDKLRLQPRGLISAREFGSLKPEKERPELLFAPFPMTDGNAMPSIARAGDGGWLVWTDVDHSLAREQKALAEELGAWLLASGTPGRRQVFIRLNAATPAHHVEALNRALCEKLDGDPSKISRAAIMRLPGGFNTKGGKRRCARITHQSERVWSAPELASALGTELPDTDTRDDAHAVSETPTAIRKSDPRYRRVMRQIDKANSRFEFQNYGTRHSLMFGYVLTLVELGVTDTAELLWAFDQCDAAVSKCSDEGKSLEHHLGQILQKPKVVEKLATSTAEPGGAVPHQPESTSAGERDEPGVTSVDDDGVSADRFPSLDWSTAWTQDYSSPDWLLGKFLERGQQIAFVAGGKEGKSLLLLHWSLALVLGWEFFGDKGDGKPKRVLYFDRENNLRDIITRARSLGVTEKDLATLAERFIYKQFPAFDGTLDDPESEAAGQLLAIVDEVKPDVVILDTASRFIKGNENDSAPWLQLYRLVHAPLKAKGVAAARIDHFGKDETKGARGNSAKAQDVDHVWEMTAKGERKERKPDGEWVVITLAMKRTHTRTGHGDDSFTVVRKGRKDAEGMWAAGCTSHELESRQDRFDEAADGLADAEKLWAYMQARIGVQITAKTAAEVIGKSAKTAERIFQGFEKDPMRKSQISRGKVDRANAWTCVGTSV
ncbi:AAA family ATPase [Streptomyces sp. CoT10]|uniref:AAA family ATPase n=1 Tax=Streptomyces sp. CoT10 TaxID=2875762 RepID=UPI001CD510AB|nr:AAA family ATPase [Streptomyces sp. CoT10]